MQGKRLIGALPVLALLAFPALAGAATQVGTEQSGGQDVVVVVDDDSAGEIQTVQGIDENTQQPFVAVQSAGGATPIAPCFAVSATIVGCFGDFDTIKVHGNGGSDTVTMDLIADGLDPLRGEAYGGLGDDTLKSPPDNRDVPQPSTLIRGDAGNDTIQGGNGPDELRGGDGNDDVDAWQGSDSVYGEGGNDKVKAGSEEPNPNVADVLDGGAGFDEMQAAAGDYNRGFDDDVAVSMDGQANDGEPGEGDNVIGVEKLQVEARNATMVGSDSADDFFVDAETSTIRGLGGNDRLVAYDGVDTIEGGDGDDYLEGGFHNDVLDGGGGVDQFMGDRLEQDVIAIGNDRILARDGNAEQVDCGIGSDTAQVDVSDAVANCEVVERGEVDPPDQPFAVALERDGRLPKLGAALRRGLEFSVETDRAGTATVELLTGQPTRGATLRAAKVVARGKATASNPGTVEVKVRFTRKAKKRYRDAKKLKLTARATVVDSAGVASAATKRIVLKR